MRSIIFTRTRHKYQEYLFLLLMWYFLKLMRPFPFAQKQHHTNKSSTSWPNLPATSAKWFTSAKERHKSQDNMFQWLSGSGLFVCVWVCACVRCRFCSPRHTTLGSMVLPVINTGLKSPTVTVSHTACFVSGLIMNYHHPPMQWWLAVASHRRNTRERTKTNTCVLTVKCRNCESIQHATIYRCLSV